MSRLSRDSFAPVAARRLPLPVVLVAAVALLGLSGCQDDPAPALVPVTTIHDQAWAEPGSGAFHGRFALREGVASCRDCHGADLGGGERARLPRLPRGHPEPAHPAGWGAEDRHGTAVIVDGGGACAACHGADYRGGVAGVSCFRCHDGPGGHAAGWADAVRHGAAAGGAGRRRLRPVPWRGFPRRLERRVVLHVPSRADRPPSRRLRGTRAARRRGHRRGGAGGLPVLPPGWTTAAAVRVCRAATAMTASAGTRSNWDAPSRHGSAVEDGGAAACAACHGADFLGGWSATSCYECHDGPGGHPVGWSHYTGHGRTASLYGPAACGTCHGVDYQGGWSGITCYQCHVGPYAVHPLGWAEPDAHGRWSTAARRGLHRMSRRRLPRRRQRRFVLALPRRAEPIGRARRPQAGPIRRVISQRAGRRPSIRRCRAAGSSRW
ncbi:MAG: hypothetical protein IPH48_16870 [bacterium]|nr:hypothetical protein [bacterium]